MPIVKARISPAQAKLLRLMQDAPNRPHSIRRLDKQRLKTANALCERGLVEVKAWDGYGVDFVLTEQGRAI